MDKNLFAYRVEQMKSRLYRMAYLYMGSEAMALDAVEAAECCTNPTQMNGCCFESIIPVTLILVMNQKPEIVNGEINHVTIGFDEAVPSVVVWEGEIFDNFNVQESHTRTIGKYSFIINIDEVFSKQEIYEVNESFILDGQQHTITTVELNPAHTRVNIESDWMNNTKHLQRLVFYMINERGERFDPPALGAGGLINLPTGGSGDDGPWRLGTHFLETAFFTESESLTLVITGVEWIGMELFGPDTIWLEEPIEIRVK